jgi:hypothetical protein
MTFHRGIDGSEPLRAQPVSRLAGAREDRYATLPWVLGTGTLACPRCDAPVALGGRAFALTAALSCPFCRHGAALRDFLSLAEPARPARVEIRMLPRVRRRRGRRTPTDARR